MIHPIALASRTGGVVIRVGGNSITPRGAEGVDQEALRGVVSLVRNLAGFGLRVSVVTGGVGGNVFLDWARSVGCPDALMNEIGCSLIDLGSTIMADHLSRALEEGACCPRPARSIQDLRTLLDTYRVVVSSAGIAGATTSDSLSLLIGEALGNPVLSIKRNLPFRAISRDAGSKQEDHTCYVTVAEVEEEIKRSGITDRAGWHPSLDAWSLRILRRPSVSLRFTSNSSLTAYSSNGHLSEVMKVTM
ncbi:hypothetical protein [Streptomyces sp. NPDC005573]|uniref:hypothetical protein n=1 Tax=unclassified Streptomyces TaxID=2593676 RepID=UPI0033BA2B2A